MITQPGPPITQPGPPCAPSYTQLLREQLPKERVYRWFDTHAFESVEVQLFELELVYLNRFNEWVEYGFGMLDALQFIEAQVMPEMLVDEFRRFLLGDFETPVRIPKSGVLYYCPSASEEDERVWPSPNSNQEALKVQEYLREAWAPRIQLTRWWRSSWSPA